jgi:chromosome transmission fidelity protein 18
MAESARLAAEAAAQLQLGDPAAPGTSAAVAAAAAGPAAGVAAAPEARLWVDKYAPSGFTQLLSDEWVNREVAKWARGWLPGARPEPEDDEADGGGGGGRGGGGGLKRKWGRGGSGRWRRRGISRREAPVLLICGPPGERGGRLAAAGPGAGRGGAPASGQGHACKPSLQQACPMQSASPSPIQCKPRTGTGKTTLAHVVAEHCGFRVVEINASDDRWGLVTPRVTLAVA